MTTDSDGDNGEVINDALQELGIGKFQVIIYTFIIVPTVLNVMSNNTFVFTSRDTEYRCLIPECEAENATFGQNWLWKALPFEDGAPDKCNRFAAIDSSDNCESVIFDNKTIEECEEWVFGDGNTVVKDFKIPCEDWKRSLVATASSAGLLVSLLFSGVLSDKYGRRNTMVGLMFVGGFLGLFQTFAWNYWIFVALEFFNLSIGAGSYSIAYVFVAETLPPRWRIYGCAVMEVTNSLSIAAVGALAWVLPSWKHLLRLIHAPLLGVPIILLIVPESIRWLYAKGKYEECEKIYKKAAKINGTTLSSRHIFELQEISTTMIKSEVEDKKEEVTFIAMFRSRRLLTRLLLCSYCWFASILSYDGLSINSVNAVRGDDNPFLNFILVTLVELPSILLYLAILKYFNRRTGLSIAYIGAGSLCILYELTDNFNETFRFSIYLLGKLFTNTSLACMYVYSSEMFPTVLRSSSMNFCYVFGGIAGMISPQILLLEDVYKSLPMFIFGIISMLSAVTVFRLPETKGIKIPDTLADAEMLK